MRDSTIVTRADVYTVEMPSTSGGVMMSGESPPPLQSSVPSSLGFDTPDDPRFRKISSRTHSEGPETTSDAEVIEEVVPIVQKTLPVLQPQPKVERNGVDLNSSSKKSSDRLDGDESCLVNCIYFMQQCCECKIL